MANNIEKLAEVIKIPMLREGQPYKEYLDLLAVTLRNMLELITKNSNVLQQIIIVEGGGGKIDHHVLDGLHTAGDHTAADVTNVPYVAGAIVATTVQAAINELADERALLSHTHAPANITFAATKRVLGRISAGGGAGEELSVLDADLIPQITEAKQTLADNTTHNVSASMHGYCPITPADIAQVLRGDGTWGAVPDASANKRITESTHASSETLDSTDLFKINTDRGASNGETIELTLPDSPTEGDWMIFAHVQMDTTADPNDAGDFIITCSGTNEKIMWTAADSGYCHKITLGGKRGLQMGPSVKLVALSDGKWLPVAETDYIPITIRWTQEGV